MDNRLWKGRGRVLKPCQLIGLISVGDNEKVKILLKQKVTRIKLHFKVSDLTTTRSNDSKMNSMQNTTTTTTAVCVSMHMCPCTYA